VSALQLFHVIPSLPPRGILAWALLTLFEIAPGR
jgi:hypothetical protein